MKSYLDIPGYFDFAKTYDLVVEHLGCPKGGGTLIECGCYLGRSLCYLGQKVKESGKPWKVYGIDNCDGLNQDHNSSTENLFTLIKNVEDCDLNGIVSIIVDDSILAANAFFDESVSFVFLDTLHTYEHLSKEVAAWLPKLRVNGVLAGDDVGVMGEENPVWPDVKRVVDELLPGWVYSPHDCFLWHKR